MDMYGAMRLFRRIVETGSFAQASRDFDITPSSASRQIGALEDMLGAPLLTRTTRKLTMTEAGELYFERIVSILDDLDEANRLVVQLLAAPRGTLRINSTVTFGHRCITPFLPEFLSRYPEIRLELTLTEKVVDLIEERVDIAIRIGRLKDSGLVSRKLLSHRFVLCATPDYLRRRGTPHTADDLLQHNCLAFDFNPGGDTWYVGPVGSREEITISGSLRANSLDVLHDMTTAGVGIGILPDWVAGSDLASGRIVEVLRELDAAPAPVNLSAVHAIFAANRRNSPKVRAFLEFLSGKLDADNTPR